ncbi:MAG: hypothetical protein AAB708_00245 [Patescibacteria group bacterium]
MAENETPEIFGSENKGNFFSRLGKKWKWLLLFFLFLLFIILAYFGYQRFFASEAELPLSQETAPQSEFSENPTKLTPSEQKVSDVILFGDTNYESESYKIGDIAIGGEAEFLLTEETPGPLEITGIRGEAFSEKSKQQMKLVLTWKTNKLAKSEVRYSKGVGQTAKTISEEEYSFSHSVIIGGLDQASTYVYTIVSFDRFGGQMESEPHAVYTGSKTVSLFDLIADAIGEVFGWAVKK